MQRGGVGEDVALREGPGLGLAVAQAGDAVVQDAAARPHHPRELRGVEVDLARAHVLDHADGSDRVEGLLRQRAVVGNAELDPVVEA